MQSKSRKYGDEGLFLGPILGTIEKTP